MMKKRFLSFLTAACMVFALLPVTARAAGATITDIAVTMTEPQVGQTLPRDAKVTSPANVTVAKIQWYSGTGGELSKSAKIEQGKMYVLTITVEIASGTDAEFAPVGRLKPTVNGKEATFYIPPTQTARFSMQYYFAKPVEAPPPIVAPEVENYDTFDYRAYANIYPDVKAAYGYDAEKLYAHYVNYGKAEGRVGSFISGDNPKTNAPITADNADGRLATLLNPYPPTLVTKQPDWAENRYTPTKEMSNDRLVAEYWFTQAYQKEGFEAFAAMPHGGPVQNDGKHTWANDTVQVAVSNVRDELYARVSAVENGYGERYEAATASDTTILFQFRDLRDGKFPAPPADPGTAGSIQSVGGFTDVMENQFFAQPVVWAVENGISGGTGEGKFSPYSKCTEGQVVTFLWRAAGSLEPTRERITYIDKNAYYYKAVQWADEKDMLRLPATPERICTRSEAIRLMWEYADKPSAAPAGFSDVSDDDYFAKAVDWAVEQGITSGVGDNKFAPYDTCTRGQIMTFLYRAFAK